MDGPALQSEFNSPYGVAIDPRNGNIIVSDFGNNRIRLINITSGIVSNIAGNGSYGYLNGPALQSEFFYPSGVAIDPRNGNIIVADTVNIRIRLINITSGNVSTIAGNGYSGYLNGPALQSGFYSPYGVAIDPRNGNIIVADSGNNRIALLGEFIYFIWSQII